MTDRFCVSCLGLMSGGDCPSGCSADQRLAAAREMRLVDAPDGGHEYVAPDSLLVGLVSVRHGDGTWTSHPGGVTVRAGDALHVDLRTGEPVVNLRDLDADADSDGVAPGARGIALAAVASLGLVAAVVGVMWIIQACR